MIGKFGRNYRLDVLTSSGKLLTITDPLTIQFNVVRNTLASANTVSIKIYNLAKNTRNQIFKDRYDINEYIQVRLQAGYKGRLHTVFQGNIYEAYSYKENVDWITTIDGFDGINAIQNAYTSVTVESGTPKQNYIEQILSDLPNLVAGALGSPAQADGAARGKTLLGQTTQVLSEETSGEYFIDLETVNILADEEVIRGQVIRLDSGDLLSTPRRRESFLTMRVLFQPQVQIGHVYEVNSLEERFNGQYKIVGFTHDVEISGAQAGSATTDLQLFYPVNGLQEV